MWSANDILFWSKTTTKFLFTSNHGFDTVIHVLNELDFRESKPPFVGDVVDVIVRFGMFSVGASDLDIVFVCNCLELVLFQSKTW